MLKTLGKYKLVAEVGRGAMGEVYKAIDPLIGRPVALKTITSSLVGDPELLGRFYREARSAGALEHPNIVTIYELGKSGDIPFIAMEFLEGETLEKVIKRRAPLSLVEKVGFIVPVCRALEYAHKRRVVHRDIKPANIMITRDGKVKVVDFGIARLMNASHTQTNAFMGTIGYMSPQMIYGERADERSDIWALGVTFYELLCYRHPFEGGNHATLMLSIAQESSKHRPVNHFLPDCSPALEAIISKLLEKDITRRFQTMDEVLAEIEPFWENLRQESVSGLMEDSETFLRAKEFLQARDLLRKALQIDSRNSRAKMLLDQISTEVRQIQTKSQVAGILERAQKLQQDGRYQEAQTELEAAVRLDPTSSEFRGLLAEVQRLVERKQAIEEELQLTRHRMAEGALASAMQEIQKVLELDSENPQGRALQKQIQNLLVRREEQKRIADFLQRARKFWGEQRHDDCVQLLTQAKNEFPRDTEITKLLETAQLDRDEHQKQAALAEARILLAAQQFDEAVEKTDSLVKQYPHDTAVQKLHDHAIREKEGTARRMKLNSEIDALRSSVNSEKFSEAVARGENLLKEFPEDPDIADLVSFARAEFEQIERKRKKEESLQGILKKIEAEQFKNAVASAEKAVARFPDDPALSSALEQARAKLKEKEAHELLQRRVAEIRAKINKGQHTDAVDLARQTLATLGPNEQAADLLRMAEIELAQKREKEREQEQQLIAAQTVVEEGRYADASQVIRAALENRLLSRKDPRVLDLLRRIKEAKAAPTQTGETTVPSLEVVNQCEPVEKTMIQFAVPMEESLHDTPTTTERSELAAAEIAREPNSARVASDVSSEPEPAIAASPSADRPSTQEVSLLRLNDVAAERVSPTSPTHEPVLPKLIEFVRQRAIPFGVGALALVIVIAVMSYVVSNRPTKEDLSLRAQAQQFEQQKNWPAALASFETLSHSGRDLASAGRDNAIRLKKLLDQENSLWTKARNSEASGDLPATRQQYVQIAGLHGDQEQQALSEVQRIDATLNPPPPAKPADSRREQSKGTGAGKSQSQSAAKETPKTATEPCRVSPADIPRRMDRAEHARADGHYSDAERLYLEVLACEPNNDKAKMGLDKTKKAREADPRSN